MLISFESISVPSEVRDLVNEYWDINARCVSERLVGDELADCVRRQNYLSSRVMASLSVSLTK